MYSIQVFWRVFRLGEASKMTETVWLMPFGIWNRIVGQTVNSETMELMPIRLE